MASFGPALRSRLFAILDVALLRLRLQKDCGLVLNRNLPFIGGNYVNKFKAIYVFKTNCVKGVSGIIKFMLEAV
jgi:hypothetical protein